MSGALIGHAGLESSPRGSLEAGSGSLPRPLTSFIGRERELAEARRLLAGSCLLTLTGPGGSGKTRLSIELAAGAAGDYPDGVYFVRLAPVRDPGLVPSSIAQGIGLQDPRDRPLVEHLVSYLRDRKLLIVLDNFEHLLPAASVVAELLSGAGGLRIVVSSRAPLRVSGEQECPVPPLALPDEQAQVALPSVAACESVRLFAERAAAVAPGFAVDEQNAAAVAQIVRRLDGLPLAIELAAARVKLLPPEAICGRLEHSLGLLTGGSRDLPRRQQTLRATIEWSYDLLGEQARGLLAACSVFRGGVPLDVIESVCAEADAGMAGAGWPAGAGGSEPAPPAASAGTTALPDAGDDPRVRGRTSGRHAGSRPPPRGARGRFPGPGRTSRAPADGARPEGMAGAARRRAQQHPRGDRLVPPGGSARRAAPGRRDVLVLVPSWSLHRRAAAAAPAARPGTPTRTRCESGP